jgi:hypothetical protein
LKKRRRNVTNFPYSNMFSVILADYGGKPITNERSLINPSSKNTVFGPLIYAKVKIFTLIKITCSKYLLKAFAKYALSKEKLV